MPIPNTDYTELITTTLDNYRDELADNILNHNPLLARLNKKGNVDPASGGARLLENLMYAENGTALWYSGYEQLSTDASDTLTSAAFDWKQFNVMVTMSGLEELQNNGKYAVFNWLKSRIRVAEITAKNAIAAALFFSNTENGGKSIGGLQHLVADLPTSGIVGGIDSAGQLWWRNQIYDFSTEGPTASATTITHAMNEIHRRTIRGTDHVDFWVAGGTYFTFFEESMQPNQRFMSSSRGETGFESYRYKGGDVFFDENCSATRMYALNTDYIFLRPHTDRNFITMKERTPTNQDATIVPMFWAGNMTVSNRSLQGLILA
ncbi:MAG: phage major capsid protein [Planctomycetaceae bacterium]|nr:MAG: phage major capsid protein [Planctomycetaceae bacterium]